MIPCTTTIRSQKCTQLSKEVLMLNCLSIHFNPAINICNLFERKMDFTYVRVYKKYAAAFAFVFQYILGSMLLDYWRMNKTPKIDFHNFQYFFSKSNFYFINFPCTHIIIRRWGRKHSQRYSVMQ